MVSDPYKFQNIAIYSSLNDKKIVAIANQVIEVLTNLGIKCLFPSSSKVTKAISKKGIGDRTIIDKSDLVIAIGGDGTLLSSARNFGIHGIPVLGINLGNLGFLTDIAPSSIASDLKKVINGDFIEDRRIFLEAKLDGEKTTYKALNEIVLHSGSIAQMIEYDLFIDGDFVYKQRADGLIISTSTGSTAYSLSGNGPIISPEVKAITLLPMFPHSLNARTLITGQEKEIKLRVNKQSRAFLSMDSHLKIGVDPKHDVLIRKAKGELTLIHPTDHNFFSSCRNKLGWSLGVPFKKS